MKRAKVLSHQVVVRLPGWLYEVVRADADQHGRTAAQSMRFILGQALPRPKS